MNANWYSPFRNSESCRSRASEHSKIIVWLDGHIHQHGPLEYLFSCCGKTYKKCILHSVLELSSRLAAKAASYRSLTARAFLSGYLSTIIRIVRNSSARSRLQIILKKHGTIVRKYQTSQRSRLTMKRRWPFHMFPEPMTLQTEGLNIHTTCSLVRCIKKQRCIVLPALRYRSAPIPAPLPMPYRRLFLAHGIWPIFSRSFFSDSF